MGDKDLVGFDGILETLKAGRKIARYAWRENQGRFIAVKLREGVPVIYDCDNNGTRYRYKVSHGDLFANDWFVL